MSPQYNRHNQPDSSPFPEGSRSDLALPSTELGGYQEETQLTSTSAALRGAPFNSRSDTDVSDHTSVETGLTNTLPGQNPRPNITPSTADPNGAHPATRKRKNSGMARNANQPANTSNGSIQASQPTIAVAQPAVPVNNSAGAIVPLATGQANVPTQSASSQPAQVAQGPAPSIQPWIVKQPTMGYYGQISDQVAFQRARDACQRVHQGLDHNNSAMVAIFKADALRIYNAILQTDDVDDKPKPKTGDPAQAVEAIGNLMYEDDDVYMTAWKITVSA